MYSKHSFYWKVERFFTIPVSDNYIVRPESGLLLPFLNTSSLKDSNVQMFTTS
uniref:Uncharacterized protein n=1 Tax=Rhizophagus irregularis (strain DAOM 181602 / DAOM 197198 / MUCL 43194) TaxID=747089 RepID=U9UN78_RHIID